VTTYAAMQGSGKAHRILEPSSASLCGIALTGDHILFDVELVPVDQRCRRCWRPSSSDPRHVTESADAVDYAIEFLISEHVERATDCYAHGMPGHGAYLLARLRLKLERLERVVDEARDALAE